MSEYFPEDWVVIKFNHEGKYQYKVFGGWRGGYLNGDTWRLNSGVVKVEDYDSHYHFYGASGSVYHCRKGSYGITGIHNNGVLQKLVESGKELNAELLSEDADFTTIIIEQDKQ